MSIAILLLQVAVVLAVCRLLHAVAERLGQPPVIGEIVAGILLGPSLLGWMAPSVFAWLFPAASLPALNFLSQIGLILFMFLVGLHLDLSEVYASRRTVGLAGLLSIAVPFALGLVLAGPLRPLSPSAPELNFSLVIAVSMSITAFPVLARILARQNLTATKLGHVAIACAAMNDVLAWCLLAWIVALSRSADASALRPVAILAAFVLVMFVTVRPALRWLHRRYGMANELSAVLILVFLASWVTELSGLHALFGAFVAGAVWPRNSSSTKDIAAKIEPLSMRMLIPLFFSYTGLQTNIGVVGDYVGLTMLVIVAAIVGKVGGAFVGARLTGFSMQDSLGLGILLNTRGLVELIVLNVGRDLGILSPALFSMLVLMALLTTFMTTPLLKWVRLEEAA